MKNDSKNQTQSERTTAGSKRSIEPAATVDSDKNVSQPKRSSGDVYGSWTTVATRQVACVHASHDHPFMCTVHITSGNSPMVHTYVHHPTMFCICVYCTRILQQFTDGTYVHHTTMYSKTSLIRHLYNPTFSLIRPLYEVQSPYISMVRGTP